MSRLLAKALLTLCLAFGFTACSKTWNFFCARGSLGEIGQALEHYKESHGGRYPVRLEELAPKYLSALPTCHWTKALPDYAVSLDGSRYGLVCWGKHFQRWASPEEADFVTLMSDRAQRPYHDGSANPEVCSRVLEDLAAKVEDDRRKKGKLATNLVPFGVITTSDGPHYALAESSDGSYQIYCARPEHVALGYAPFQPRYDSKLGRVAARRWHSEKPPKWSVSFLSVAVIISLCVALVCLRSGRRPADSGEAFRREYIGVQNRELVSFYLSTVVIVYGLLTLIEFLTTTKATGVSYAGPALVLSLIFSFLFCCVARAFRPAELCLSLCLDPDPHPVSTVGRVIAHNSDLLETRASRAGVRGLRSYGYRNGFTSTERSTWYEAAEVLATVQAIRESLEADPEDCRDAPHVVVALQELEEQLKLAERKRSRVAFVWQVGWGSSAAVTPRGYAVEPRHSRESWERGAL